MHCGQIGISHCHQAILYECNTEESIRIEVSFDEFPDSFLKETSYEKSSLN